MRQEIKKITKGIILFDEPMSKHTSYGIGGPARVYVTPKNKEDLVSILKFSKDNNIP